LVVNELSSLVKRVRPDVAHVHNTWFALSPAAVAALDRAGVPVVVTLHNYRLLCANGQLFRDGRPCQDCVGSHPWHGVRHRCYRDSALMSVPAGATIALNRRHRTWERHVAVFLATTEFAKQRFIAGGLPGERIWVKPHFVADPGPPTVPPSRSKTVLYVGRLSKEKGPDVLVKAVAELQDCDLEWVIVGSGPEQESLQRRAGPRVRFAGLLTPEQVRDKMRRARALVFPSVCYETFGMSMVEAMAMGLPIIASDLGGAPEIVGDQAGRLVPPGDVGAWAKALRRLTEDQFVDRAGAAARQRWQQRFSPSVALPRLEQAYRRGLASSG
jgi:glycosyltransferase involved in cell wall biosynthesis